MYNRKETITILDNSIKQLDILSKHLTDDALTENTYDKYFLALKKIDIVANKFNWHYGKLKEIDYEII